MTKKTLNPEIEAWLRAFATAVRERDFQSGRALCADDIVGFGTVCNCAVGLHSLEHMQWREVWPHTDGFEFHYAEARCAFESMVAVVMTEWHSTGYDAARRPFERRGRATIALKRLADEWKAIHTHFSLGSES